MKIGVQRFIPERLIQARLWRGLTQDWLEELSGVTRQSISNYESGKNPPTPDNLESLARELRFPISFFQKPIQSHFDGAPRLFRSLRSVGEKDKERAATFLTWVAETVDYTLSYVDLPSLNLPDNIFRDLPKDPRRIDEELIVDLANSLRQHWNLANFPVPNMVRLLEANGIIVNLLPLELPGIDGLSMWSQIHKRPYMLINSDSGSLVRTRLSAGHELGHLILHNNLHVENRKLNKDISKILDEQANLFAASFLLPESSFPDDVYSLSLSSLKRIKPKWKVSIAAMIRRLKYLGFVSENKYRSLMVDLSKAGWRRIEPFDNEWEMEEPVLLKQALQIITQEGIQDAQLISYELHFDVNLLKKLTWLEDDFFDMPSPDNVITLNFR